jgi:hypothetical protein
MAAKIFSNAEKNEGNKVTIIIPFWLFTRKFTGLKQSNQKRDPQHPGILD